jgi:hypothetical protein
MRKDVAKAPNGGGDGVPVTLNETRERIAAVRARHLGDLQRMYAFHAEEYLEEAMDQYLAWDEKMYLAEGENNPVLVGSYKKLDVSISFFLHRFDETCPSP